MVHEISYTMTVILLGGDGRSGTTLMSVLLDSHSLLSVGPELHFGGPPNLTHYLLPHALERSKDPSYLTEKELENDREKISAARFMNRLKRFGVGPDALVTSINEALARGNYGAEFPERLEIVEELAAKRAKVKKKILYGLKIMKMVKDYERFLKHKPESKIVHIVRDGRDVASSQIKDFSWGYQSIELAAEGWGAMARSAIRLKESGMGLVVRYEDVVTTPSETLQNVFEFLEVPYEATHTSINTGTLAELGHHPSAAGISKGINLSSIGRYTEDLIKDDVKIMNEKCIEELSYFDYLGQG